jgi:hypothetical protein
MKINFVVRGRRRPRLEQQRGDRTQGASSWGYHRCFRRRLPLLSPYQQLLRMMTMSMIVVVVAAAAEGLRCCRRRLPLAGKNHHRRRHCPKTLFVLRCRIFFVGPPWGSHENLSPFRHQSHIILMLRSSIPAFASVDELDLFILPFAQCLYRCSQMIWYAHYEHYQQGMVGTSSWPIFFFFRKNVAF